MSVRTKVMAAKVKVTEMLPLTLAPKGKMGIKPIRLLIRMKKNTVNKKGMNRSYFGPMFAFATSSRTNRMIGSMKL